MHRTLLFDLDMKAPDKIYTDNRGVYAELPIFSQADANEEYIRNFQKYDVLHLQEWVNGCYTKREITADVTYILDDPAYCKEGFVIIGIHVVCVNN